MTAGGELNEVDKQRIVEGWTGLETRFDMPVTVGKTKKQKEYIQKILKPKTNDLKAILRKVALSESREHKSMRKTISYDDGKLLLKQIIRTKLGSQGRQFEYSGNDLEVWDRLLKYFVGAEDCDLDFRKGICLAGNVGMGKTFVLECFQVFCRQLEFRTFSKVGAGDIYEAVSSAKNSTMAMKKYYKGNWFFDDLGTEPLIYQDFGNPIALMDRVIFKRNEAFRNGLCITHITTNLNGKDIKKRYGERFFDRFKEMFNVVQMTGNSKR